MLDKAAKTRYDLVAIALHWVMAIAFILMLGSGIAMTDDNLLPQSL